MIEKLRALKKKNKLLYYIGLPLLGVALLVTFIASIMSDFNISKAKEQMKDTQKEDFDLEAEQKAAEHKAKELQRQAAGHKEKAEAHEEKVEEVDADEDWHLKD